MFYVFIVSNDDSLEISNGLYTVKTSIENIANLYQGKQQAYMKPYQAKLEEYCESIGMRVCKYSQRYAEFDSSKLNLENIDSELINLLSEFNEKEPKI